jgi:transcriptional regulator with XRE-family HTH domain
MKINQSLSDEAILGELAARVRRARLDQSLTQADLAAAAGLSRPTVERFESAGVANLATLIRILRALGLVERLDAALPEALIRPIEALETRGEGRKRASRPRKPPPPPKSWTWGDQR